jgi:hypothetical protein
MTGVSRISDRVPVAPLREAFVSSKLTSSELCYRLGWVRLDRRFSPPREYADTQRLRRALGLAPNWNASAHAFVSVATRIGYDNATRIAEAIGVDPVDVGL